METATALVPIRELVPRPALTTGLPVLDRMLGEFEASRLTFVDSGSDFAF